MEQHLGGWGCAHLCVADTHASSSCARAPSPSCVGEVTPVRCRRDEMVDVSCRRVFLGGLLGRKTNSTVCWVEVQLRGWNSDGTEKDQLTKISTDRHVTRSQPGKSRLVYLLQFTVVVVYSSSIFIVLYFFFTVLYVHSMLTVLNSIELPVLTEERDRIRMG